MENKTLSVDELIELAKKPIKDDELKKLPPVKRFVVSSGIEEGSEKIPAILIYDRYLNWAKAYKVKHLNKSMFFKELSLYFDKVRISKGFAYVMSPKGFNLTPEYYQLVNQQNPTFRKRTSGNGKTKKEKNS